MTFPRRLLPLVALGFATLGQGIALAGSSLYRISVSGMVCSFCAQGIEKRLKAIPGAESVRIDLSKGMVEVTARHGATLDPATLKRAVRDAGYDVRRIDGPAESGAAGAGKPGAQAN
jgi:mercuric ion binding protein